MEEGKYVFVFNKINEKGFSNIENLKWKNINKKNKIIFTYSKESKQIKNPEKKTVRFNPKTYEFECQKYIDPCPIFAEYEMSKLHHFINKKVLESFNINNYGFGGDFIIFDDLTAILIEYGKTDIYQKIKEGYIRKLDKRNIFQKIIDKFRKK